MAAPDVDFDIAQLLDEFDLRSRAVAQIRNRVVKLAARGYVPRWTRETCSGLVVDDDRISADVDLLVAGSGPARAHAAFLAVMFLHGPVEVGAWSATPLGVLCGRVLADAPPV